MVVGAVELAGAVPVVPVVPVVLPVVPVALVRIEIPVIPHTIH
jgi:hypothetical protein